MRHASALGVPVFNGLILRSQPCLLTKTRIVSSRRGWLGGNVLCLALVLIIFRLSLSPLKGCLYDIYLVFHQPEVFFFHI